MYHHHLLNWNQLLKKHRNPFLSIKEPLQLINMFVFDVWIGNIDRNNKNIILHPLENQYDFYLIDHALTLLGSMKWKRLPWNSPSWNSVAKYNRRYLTGLPSFIKRNERYLLTYVQKIQGLSKETIDQILREVPKGQLSYKQREILSRFLIKRKSNLLYLVKRWIKEYKRVKKR